MDFTQPSVTTDELAPKIPDGTMVMMLSKSLLTHFAYYFRNYKRDTWSYQAMFNDINLSTMSPFVEIVSSPTSREVALNYEFLFATSSLMPCSQSWFPYTHNDHSYVFLTGYTIDVEAPPLVVQFNMQGTPPDNYAFRIYRAHPDGNETLEMEVSADAPGVTVTAAITVDGYYRFAMVTSADDTVCSVGLILTGTYDLWAFKPLPQLDVHMTLLGQCRVNSASLMFSPDASVLNQNGFIAAAQYPMETCLTELTASFSTDPTDTVTMQNSMNFGKFSMRQGCFAYHRPSSSVELAMTDVVSVEGWKYSVRNNPMAPPGGWLVMALAGQPGVDVNPGCFGHVTTCAHLEYSTTSEWIIQASNNETTADTMAAIDALRHVPQFHENPLHFTDILRSVKRGFAKALVNLPRIIDFASIFTPMANAARPFAAPLSQLGTLIE